MKKVILLGFILAATSTFAQQEAKVSRGSIGIGMHLACPQSELQDIKYDEGFGLNLSYLSRKYPYQSKTNFQLGARMDFANMKSKSFENILLSDPSIIGNATAKASNKMYGTFLLGRINFGNDNDKVIPYVDLLIGHRNYTTSQLISLDQPTQNPEYQSDTFTSRIVHTNRFHYGGSLGVNYRINSSISLEASVTYTFGEKGAALPLGNITREAGTNEIDYNDYKTVKTDLLLINAGVRIHLFKHYRDKNNTNSSTPNTPSNTRYKDTDSNPSNNNDPIIKNRNTPTPRSIPIPKKKTPIKIKPNGPTKEKDERN
jgi:hypothetical protein